MMPYLSYLAVLIVAAMLAACESKEQQLLAEGQQIYQKNCKVCHAQGINGAPILGNRKMWSARAEQGKETLVEHAIDGFGLMPAKGGKADLAKADIEKVVAYMLSQLD